MKQALMVFAIVASATGLARAEFTVYDDFDGTELDTSKWAVSGAVTVVDSECQWPGGDSAAIGTYPDVFWPRPTENGQKLTFEYSVRKHAGTSMGGQNTAFIIMGAMLDGSDNWDESTRGWHGGAMPRNTWELKNAQNDGWTVSGFEYPAADDFDNDYLRLEYSRESDQDNFRIFASSDAETWEMLMESLDYLPTTDFQVLAPWFWSKAQVAIGYLKVEEAAQTQTVGDANLDGIVNDADLSLLLAHWDQDVTQEPDGGWGKGEFNGTAPVSDNDLSLLLANWTAGGAVPEPSTALVMLVGFAAAALRRGRT